MSMYYELTIFQAQEIRSGQILALMELASQ